MCIDEIKTRRQRNILISLVLLFFVALAFGIHEYPKRHFIMSPVVAKANEVIIPSRPAFVPINGTSEKDALEAARKAMLYVGNLAESQCRWNEDKLVRGDYDKLITFHVWNDGKTAFAQVVVDRSTCPETK